MSGPGVSGRYRALLIGNSTYPADEHNLQALKGPVKDIAALNRALADRDTGLFADVDVALLPETTSARAIRALGRFFGTATRDDVLLVYFSGHGKLDQSGRLHLCMQDTESTDLLSTAVSSARISEFADASRARNVVIVLDCCHAGAFRGSDLGDAVAGPGRYVLTSCRGTQLANDATVENGTSFFTQHLVDGLLDAAADQDGDGFISFSDLYAYVDRQLREAGKQIPQRRVDGDGDLRLARRPVPALAGAAAAAGPPVLDVSPPRLDLGEVLPGHMAELRVSNHGGGELQWTYDAADNFYRVERTPAGLLLWLENLAGRHSGHLIIQSNGGHADVDVTATIRPGRTDGRPGGGSPRDSTKAGDDTTAKDTASAPPGPGHGRARRKIVLAVGAAVIAVAGGVIAALVLLGGSGGSLRAGPDSYTASAPWRLQIVDHIVPTDKDDGCIIQLTDVHSGAVTQLPVSQYRRSKLQIHRTGSFKWAVNDPGCKVTPLAGPGTNNLPFSWDQVGAGDTNAFAAPSAVAVHITSFHGRPACKVALFDPADGQIIGSATATPGKDTVVLDTHGAHAAYLRLNFCSVQVHATR